MIERVMSLPIFMFTRVALSTLISAIAGIMMISFLYLAWTFAEDIYLAVSPEKEVAPRLFVENFSKFFSFLAVFKNFDFFFSRFWTFSKNFKRFRTFSAIYYICNELRTSIRAPQNIKAPPNDTGPHGTLRPSIRNFERPFTP